MSKRGNGEGTIYFSEKLNKWVGQFTAGRKDNGKLNRKSVYGNTRKEVKEKMTKALAEVQSKTYIEKNQITLIDLIQEYVNNRFEANKFSEVTYLRKQETIQVIRKLSISEMPIQKIKILDINASLPTIKNYSTSVLKKVLGLLSSVYDYAIILNIITSNPFKIANAINKPQSEKETKDIEALTIDEQKAFLRQLEICDDKYKDILYIAIYTGMRIGEILALKGSDIDMNNKTISITKTITKNINGEVIFGTKVKTYSSKRVIPFLNVLNETLSKYANITGYIFTNNYKPIANTTINIHFKKICKDANIKVYYVEKKRVLNNNQIKKWNQKCSNVNAHMLRHTFATRCIEAGMSAVVLSKLLGHKDIETTLNTYTSVFNSFKENELDKAEKYLVALNLH